MLLIYRVIQDQNVLYLQAKCMLHTVHLPWLFLQACTWFCQIYFHSSCCLLSPHMHILHTLPRARLLCSPSLQEGWVCGNSWKYISFFGKTAVNLMFNPRASVAVAPAHSVLITQPGNTVFIIEQRRHLTDVGRVIWKLDGTKKSSSFSVKIKPKKKKKAKLHS